MKTRGFTLIELLAVIVILAIIALIAVPIILNIIEDAKKESDERSVELYASAIKNGIAAHQLRTGNEVTPGAYNSSNLPITVEYEGNVECETTEIYADGNIYLEGCTVNGGEETYPYGTKQETQVYKPQYYYFGYDFSITVGETEVPENPSSVPPTGEIRYLGYDVTDGVITAAYACFVKNENEYCLKGYDTSVYATNQAILENAFKDVENSCSFLGEGYSCYRAGDLYVEADSHGVVGAKVDDVFCYGDYDKIFHCIVH